MAGDYTAFGPVEELVADTTTHWPSSAPARRSTSSSRAPAGAAAEGWTRRLVLETDGWCKDMDLYTRDGGTLEPLPARGEDPALRVRLHETYNTRYQSGR